MDNALVVNICINDDPSIALEEAGSFLADYYIYNFRPIGRGIGQRMGPHGIAREL